MPSLEDVRALLRAQGVETVPERDQRAVEEDTESCPACGRPYDDEDERSALEGFPDG